MAEAEQQSQSGNIGANTSGVNIFSEASHQHNRAGKADVDNNDRSEDRPWTASPTALAADASTAGQQQVHVSDNPSTSLADLLNPGGALAATAVQQTQIQQLMQQQNLYSQHQQLGDLMRGQLLALQERLQLNLVHQSQLMQQLCQCKDKKMSGQVQLQIHQLLTEQQQLMQQIQIQQRHYLMQQGLVNPGLASSSDMQKFWQDFVASSTAAEMMSKSVSNTGGNGSGLLGGLLNGSAGSSSNAAAALASTRMLLASGLVGAGASSDPIAQQLTAASQRLLAAAANGGQSDLTLSHLAAAAIGSAGSNLPITHPLYQRGLCAWPSCETPCDSLASFASHLNTAHALDDRSTAQCRVQMQVVEQLEVQVNRERQRLHAMMQHLQMKQSPDTTTSTNGNVYFGDSKESSLISPESATSPSDRIHQQSQIPSGGEHSLVANLVSAPFTCTVAPEQACTESAGVAVEESSAGLFSQQPPRSISNSPNFNLTASTAAQNTRRRVSDKSMLPIGADIARNRDFYRNHDVRPPYTYASLIRQAIMEAKDNQLTLNEIYTWFQDTFAYFRRNAATWKNAVRHNLSLHKCFTRVENVKGAVWTVDEAEFYKRRPQRLSNPTGLPARASQRLSPYSAVSDILAAAAATAAVSNASDSQEFTPKASSNCGTPHSENGHIAEQFSSDTCERATGKEEDSEDEAIPQPEDLTAEQCVQSPSGTDPRSSKRADVDEPQNLTVATERGLSSSGDEDAAPLNLASDR